MSDLSITATQVVAGTGASVIKTGVYGETVTAGQCVYQKSTDSKWYKAVATSGGTAEQSGYGVSFGVALVGGAANQPAYVQTGGPITIGATVAAGVWYYVSQTAAGGIGPVADLGSGDFVTIIGYGLTTSTMQIVPTATGLTLA